MRINMLISERMFYSILFHCFRPLALGQSKWRSCLVPVSNLYVETRSSINIWIPEKHEIKADDFRYMKFIYLQCGEEMKLRDPRN